MYLSYSWQISFFQLLFSSHGFEDFRWVEFAYKSKMVAYFEICQSQKIPNFSFVSRAELEERIPSFWATFAHQSSSLLLLKILKFRAHWRLVSLDLVIWKISNVKTSQWMIDWMLQYFSCGNLIRDCGLWCYDLSHVPRTCWLTRAFFLYEPKASPSIVGGRICIGDYMGFSITVMAH